MREVKFTWGQRIEMAVAWAFPISFVLTLIVIPFWREAVSPLVFLIWGLSFLIFLSFPLYSHWLSSESKRIGFIFFDFGRGGFQLILLSVIIVGLATHSILAGDFTWGFIFRWSFINDLFSSKHSGVRALFNREFIKTGIVREKLGDFYNNKFEFRQKGDYGDFVEFEKEKVHDRLKKTEHFIRFEHIDPP